MILLIQRVSEANVRVDDDIVGQIGPGLLAFVAVEPGDDDATARRLVDRAVSYRVFGDDAGRMNLSLADTGGELLLVSQFTLAADTRKGPAAELHDGRAARTRPTTVRAGRRIRPRRRCPARSPRAALAPT